MASTIQTLVTMCMFFSHTTKQFSTPVGCPDTVYLDTASDLTVLQKSLLTPTSDASHKSRLSPHLMDSDHSLPGALKGRKKCHVQECLVPSFCPRRREQDQCHSMRTETEAVTSLLPNGGPKTPFVFCPVLTSDSQFELLLFVLTN